MKRIFIIIGLLLLVGCLPTSESIDETLMESVLIRDMLFQIKSQDSIIAQLVGTLAEQTELLYGFDELNQQQNQINRQVFTAIKLLSDK